MRLRLPRYIELPFGYTIKVILTTDEDILDTADGVWDVESHTIYIRRTLPPKRRRYILIHEMGHAWLDFQHQHMDDGVAAN